MVVLPEPVGPVTRTNPRGRRTSSVNTGGVPNSLKSISLAGINRKHHPHAALLLEDRHAEPAHVAEGETEVAAAHLLQFLLAPLGRDALHQRHGVFRLQDLGFQPDQVAVDANHRRLAHGNVQVARLAVDDRLEQFVDKDACHLPHLPR